MVAAAGFTSSAIEMARAKGVELLTVVSAEEHDWRSFIKVPMGARIIFPKVRFSLQSSSAIELITIPDPFGLLILYDRSGAVIDTVHNLFWDCWDREYSKTEPGTSHTFLLTDQHTFAKGGDLLHEVSVIAHTDTDYHFYWSNVPLEDATGFRNAADGSYISSEIKSSGFSFDQIEATWSLLEPGASPPVPLFLTLYVSESSNRIALDGKPILPEQFGETKEEDPESTPSQGRD